MCIYIYEICMFIIYVFLCFPPFSVVIHIIDISRFCSKLHCSIAATPGPGALQRARRSHRAARIFPAQNAKVRGTFGKSWENHGKTYGKPMDMSRKNIHEIPYDVLVGGLEHVFFSIQLGMPSSQLTKSIIFQRGRYTTNQIFMNRRSTILHGFLIVSQLLWIQIQ